LPLIVDVYVTKEKIEIIHIFSGELLA